MATEYNMADYESEEEEGEDTTPSLPPEQNLFSAALFLQALLVSHQIPHALTGGFSLRLRGSERQARQIDFAVQPQGGMRQLKEMLRPYSRVQYPNICEGIMKIFVETGPGYDESAISKRIEVDLKGPGIAGNPVDLDKCRMEVTADAGKGRIEKFILLDLFHALNGKLKVLYERRYERDFQDVQWFLSKYAESIRKLGDELDEDGLRAFIDSLPGEKRGFYIDFFQLSDSESEHGSQ